MNGHATVTIASRSDDAQEWTQHALGSLRIGVPAEPPAPLRDRAAIEARCTKVIDGATHYQRIEEQEIFYGKLFRGVSQISLGDGEVMARVTLPAEVNDSSSYVLHPALLDACFQCAAWCLRSSTESGTFVPVQASGIRMFERPSRNVWVYGKLASKAGLTLSLIARDDAGRALFEVGELRIQRLGEGTQRAEDPFAHCVFDVEWRRKDLAKTVQSNVPKSAWLVVLDERGLGHTIAEQLRARGHFCIEVAAGREFTPLGEREYRLEPTDATQWTRLLTTAFANLTCRGIVHCTAVDGAPWNETTETTLWADLRRGPLAALRIAQSILRQNWPRPSRLYLLTRGAQAVGSNAKSLSVGPTALCGFGPT